MATGRKDICKIFREGRLIDEAMNAAVRDAVQLHKEKGLPLVVWRDGKAVWISAEEAEALAMSRDAARATESDRH
jgi:hypothetical protein